MNQTTALPLGVVLWALLAAAAVGTPVEPPDEFILPIELRPVRKAPKPLDPDRATVFGPDGARHSIRLRCLRTRYDALWVRGHDGRAEEVTGRPICIELMPAEGLEALPYTWSFWWDSPPYGPRWFWLFTVGERKTYLVFSEGPALWLANVTEPRDRTVAFCEDILPVRPGRRKAYESVPVGALAGKRMRELGGDFSYRVDRPWTEPLSLTRDEEGNLVLSVRYTHNDFRGTLTKKDGEWELVEAHWPEGAEKPEPDEQPEEERAERLRTKHGLTSGAAVDGESAALWPVRYQQWREFLNSPEARKSSGPAIYESEEYKAIIELGPGAAGEVVEAMAQEPEVNHLLEYALARMTRVKLLLDERRAARTNEDRIALWLQWWNAGQKGVNEQFKLYYEQGSYEDLRRMGVPALPRMMQKLRAGDEQMLPIIRDLTNGEIDTSGKTPQEQVRSALAWWKENKQKWIIPFPDQGKVEPPPVKK